MGGWGVSKGKIVMELAISWARDVLAVSGCACFCLSVHLCVCAHIRETFCTDKGSSLVPTNGKTGIQG